MSTATTLQKPGMLPRQLVKEAVARGWIRARQPFSESAFQPASLDLRLGDKAYRLRATFLPHPQQSIEASIESLAEHSFDLDPSKGAILENNHYYLLPIEEELDLPDYLQGRVSPKSSIGRLDVLVRVLAEKITLFDHIPPGYKGRLYALVGPRSFAVVVRPGTCLTQLRLLTVTPGAVVPDQELSQFWSQTPLLYRPRSGAAGPRPIDYEQAMLDEGVFLSADFHRPPKKPLAYRPCRAGSVIDLAKINHYAAEDYWGPVLADHGPNTVRLVPDEFYLLRCQEKLSIPPSLAAEMLPYDARLGELRSHYAGFFDPGFGYAPSEDVLGTRAVLEVRTQEPFVIRHGHALCRLQFFRMIEEPDVLYGDPRLGSSYQQQQRHPFSKHFITKRRSDDSDSDTQNELDFP